MWLIPRGLTKDLRNITGRNEIIRSIFIELLPSKTPEIKENYNHIDFAIISINQISLMGLFMSQVFGYQEGLRYTDEMIAAVPTRILKKLFIGNK